MMDDSILWAGQAEKNMIYGFRFCLVSKFFKALQIEIHTCTER